MAENPIVFRLLQPLGKKNSPEKKNPENSKLAACCKRPDVIMATVASDYAEPGSTTYWAPPFIFRGALDVRATAHQTKNEDCCCTKLSAAGPRAGNPEVRVRRLRWYFPWNLVVITSIPSP